LYKGASRFRQVLARKGRRLTSRNLVAADSALPNVNPASRRQASLRKRLDQEVKKATLGETEGYQRLVKRRTPLQNE
jgi:hypothetical protein